MRSSIGWIAYAIVIVLGGIGLVLFAPPAFWVLGGLAIFVGAEIFVSELRDSHG